MTLAGVLLAGLTFACIVEFVGSWRLRGAAQ